jgi:hypothetical protein
MYVKEIRMNGLRAFVIGFFLCWSLGTVFLVGNGEDGNGVILRSVKNAAQRIQPTDLEYLGAFRMPDGVPGSDVKSWMWGGYAMTYYPSGDPGGDDDGYPGSIFGAGHAWEHQISEFNIPVPVISASKNLNQLNTAATLQSFQDILGVGSWEMPRSGLAYLPKQGSQTSDKLYFCWGGHLVEGFHLTHGWCETDLSNPRIQRGWYLDTPHQEYNSNDYMFDIPSDWAAANTPGKLLATGRFRDGGWSGQGPTLYAIGPWNDGIPPANGASLDYVTLLRYTSSADSDSWNPATNHTMTDYHHSDEWSGAAWLTAGSKSAVVFVGTKGTGDCWYGNSEGPCLSCDDRGWWSTGFEGRFIFYDPDDLAAVANGSMEPWEPQPYAYLNIDQHLYHLTSSQQWYHLSAACFDRTNGLFYVFEPLVVAEEYKPIVHVWKVKSTGTASGIRVTSPNGGESWQAGSGHSVTWTSTGTVGNVKLEYSTDNGGNWSTLASSTANDGSFSWTLPNVGSSQCLVRVGETDGSPSDTSDSVFAIYSGGTGASMSLDRDRLIFGAGQSGTSPAAQTFSVSNVGSGTMNWTVTDNADWLSTSPTSGTDSGTVEVSVAVSGLAAGNYSGEITVSSAEAANSPKRVTVELTVYGGTGSAPFGVFATPVDGAGEIRGSIAVTGWALDDTGVDSVKIYRMEGHSSVYIGDAVFIEGARPDVELAFQDYPYNYKAGWGYMMLTNFLPNQGNGTYVIYAEATDREGNATVLGTKTITCDNVNAVNPFGAIDTPTQGGIASGDSFINWGWVLTPLPNSIPTDGSTIHVWVDGVNIGNPVYNNPRADIESFFPGYANSGGAVGYFYLDTTTYDNGLHSIQWTATDTGGNTDGIGSRYFMIRNTGNRAAKQSIEDIQQRKRLEPVEHWAGIPNDTRRPIGVKRGFGTQRKMIPVFPGNAGFVTVNIAELEPVEIHLDSMQLSGAYLRVEKELRRLPVGSTLDRRAGKFYWQPGPGFIGKYPLIFIGRSADGHWERKTVTINILPKN